GADRPRRGDVEGRPKDAEAFEKAARSAGEQLVTPLDGRGECGVPLAGAGPSADQQLKAIVQPGRELVDREVPQLGRGALDREGSSSEALTDVDDVGIVCPCRGTARGGGRPGDEESGRVGAE